MIEKGITIKDIMHGISQSRNMVIASIFSRLELILIHGSCNSILDRIK
jgi:ATP-dependent DNA helicase RecG